ncbi:MAG: N-acetylglucosamine-6-phosphate deacetylase [Verrucomicrobiales bacterium]|nr:N-acetylglucosamine-6-phosphate deacetylase [Verrucomicrobiales bacterium]MCP5526705.1 N-acetylglucosamine-6-phosphate deacetylase [Verrucomicrobiales bacterium]
MNQGSIQGLHAGTGQPVRLRWTDGRITAMEPGDAAAAGDEWLAPALFDPQINGFGGVDFQSDDLVAGDLQHSVRALQRAGCTRFLLTLITDDWERLMARLERLRGWLLTDPALRSAIVGWHVEGPFLSDEPGFRGAHPAAAMTDPTAAHIATLRRVTGEDPVLLTLAPERTGAIEAIRAAVGAGMRVSLGHTNASAAAIATAVAAGATGFTHLGNACPQTLDRHDNIVWRVLDTEGLRVSLIADGRHVSPPFMRLVHRVLGPERVLHTTDAMAAAGTPPGRYPLGPMWFEVGTDGLVRLPGGTHFAGSSLTPVEGVFRSAAMLGTSWRQTWAASSTTPAAWLGVPVSLAPGNRADFCLLRTGASGELVGLRVFARGEEIE